MNQEQVKSAIRWIIATFGPFIIQHGYASASTLEMVGGVVVSAAPLLWSMFVHTESSAVAVVTAMAQDPASPVRGVVVEANTEGRALIAAVASPGVAPAGSGAAATIARAA